MTKRVPIYDDGETDNTEAFQGAIDGKWELYRSDKPMKLSEWKALVEEDRPRASALVATEVMGWVKGIQRARGFWVDPKGSFVPYTYDGSFAMHIPAPQDFEPLGPEWGPMREVVEKVSGSWRLVLTQLVDTPGWKAEWFSVPWTWKEEDHHIAVASTAPVAVCTAILMALGVVGGSNGD